MARPVKFLKSGGVLHSDEAQDKKLFKKLIKKEEKKEGKEMKSGGFNSPKDYKFNAAIIKKEPKEIKDTGGKETSKPKPEAKSEKKEPKAEGKDNTDMARGGMRGPRGPNSVPKGLAVARKTVAAPVPMPSPTGAPGGAPGAMPGMPQGMKKGGMSDGKPGSLTGKKGKAGFSKVNGSFQGSKAHPDKCSCKMCGGGAKMKSGGVVVAAHTKDYAAKK